MNFQITKCQASVFSRTYRIAQFTKKLLMQMLENDKKKNKQTIRLQS